MSQYPFPWYQVGAIITKFSSTADSLCIYFLVVESFNSFSPSSIKCMVYNSVLFIAIIVNTEIESNAFDAYSECNNNFYKKWTHLHSIELNKLRYLHTKNFLTTQKKTDSLCPKLVYTIGKKMMIDYLPLYGNFVSFAVFIIKGFW